MKEEDSFMLNITTGGTRSPQRKQERVSKRDKLKQRRKKRKDETFQKQCQETDSRKPDEDTKSSLSEHPPKPRDKTTHSPNSQGHEVKKTLKRKSHTEDESSGSNAKRFKSLFYNNPDVPKLDNTQVAAVKEQVFSGSTFKGLDLHPFMVSNLEASFKITEATSVQTATIPHILGDKDVLVKSQTGSGKTLSYAVPIVHKLQAIRPKLQRSDGTLVLVIVPTRELALQSLETFQKLVKPFSWLVPGCLMGGEKKKSEKARLRKGLNIVISTPGRLVDHIEHTRNLELQRVQWLVIDEADRLLDMGFQKEVSTVITALEERGPKDRHTALLSATLSPGVEKLAGMSLHSPEQISITAEMASKPKFSAETTGDVFATPENLKHHCVIVPSKLRLVTLAAFILWKCKMASKRSKMLVFMSTQDAVDFHFRLFDRLLFGEETDKQSGQMLFRLHGDMPQKDRTQVFNQFSALESGVLFCTDVAARGLDLPSVKWIVQYMAPGGATDYIHRVGRTARIGGRGNALLFLTPAETNYTQLLTSCNINLVQVQMTDILRTLMMEKDKLDYIWHENETPHTVEEAGGMLQALFTEHISHNMDLRTSARKAYQSYIGAYTAYPSSVKHVFHVKNLHLGHTATSFCLQEAPSKIGNIIGTQAKKRAHPETHRLKSGPRRGQLSASVHRSNASEFSSGFTKTKLSNVAKCTRKDKKKLSKKKKT